MTQKRYRLIADQLRQKIVEGDFAVGEKLPPERELAEIYGASRPTIREALLMLEILGFVHARIGSGIHVISRKVSLTIGQLHPADDVGPFELLQARELVESEVAALAASRATKTDLARMREALDSERAALKAGSDCYGGDEMFHLLIGEATQNTALYETVRGLWSRRSHSAMWQQLHSHIFVHEYRLQWLDDHQLILAALRSRSPEKAREAMSAHLRRVRETLFAVSDVEEDGFDGYLFTDPGELKL